MMHVSIALLTGLVSFTNVISALDTASSTCPPTIVYKHSTPQHIFAIKRQATCHFQGLQWQVGKKKETFNGLKSFELFSDAAAAVNNAMEVLGLERQDIHHSNVVAEVVGSPSRAAHGGGGKKAVEAAAAAVASALASAAGGGLAMTTSHQDGSNLRVKKTIAAAGDDDVSKLESEIEAEEAAEEAAAAATTAATARVPSEKKAAGGLASSSSWSVVKGSSVLSRHENKGQGTLPKHSARKQQDTHHQQQQQQQSLKTSEVSSEATLKEKAAAAAEAAAVAAVARPPPLTATAALASSGSSGGSSGGGVGGAPGGASVLVGGRNSAVKLLKPTAPHRDKIERLLVVGERNTGTNWLFRTLEENFNTTVLNHFCGWKHFFHHPSQCSKVERSQRNTTLAIVLWKNVFDWTLSMQRNPYHMHMHFRNSFSDFIRRPMALVDTYDLSSSPDLLKQHNNQEDEKEEEREGGGLTTTTTTPGMATQQQRQQQQHSQRLQLEFNHRPLAHNLSTNPKDELPKYSDGSYCSMPLPSPDLHWQYDLFCPEAPEHLPEYSPPFYELNPDTERPFANIIRMRSAKIKNFKNMQAWMPNVAHIRFEELLSEGGQGSLDWLEHLADKWGLQPKLKRRRKTTTTATATVTENKQRGGRVGDGEKEEGGEDDDDEEGDDGDDGKEEGKAETEEEEDLFPKLVVQNPKHPGEFFNCSKYESSMFYSSCLRGHAQECCSAMDIKDATFIAEQLDRHLESNFLEYVMPNVRDLCGGGGGSGTGV